MAIAVVGDMAYELIYKSDPPLTDGQADILVAEYAKLGLRYVKCEWRGTVCIVAKAPASEYKRFDDALGDHMQSIKNRAGYRGYLNSQSNTYNPEIASFTPGADWNDVVAFIDAKFSSAVSETKPVSREEQGCQTQVSMCPECGATIGNHWSCRVCGYVEWGTFVVGCCFAAIPAAIAFWAPWKWLRVTTGILCAVVVLAVLPEIIRARSCLSKKRQKR